MILVVDVELDGCVARIRWPKRPVTLDTAGITALIRDLSLVRASLDGALVSRQADETRAGAAGRPRSPPHTDDGAADRPPDAEPVRLKG